MRCLYSTTNKPVYTNKCILVTIDRILLCVIIAIINLLLLHAKPSQDIESISQEAKDIFHIEMHNEEEYRIYKAIPKHASADLHALYMLDGNAQFPMALNIYARHIKRGDIAIIAIGHNGGLAYNTNFRAYNYTIDTIDSYNYRKTGGVAKFYNVLKRIVDDINRQYNIKKTSFFGHSFGGLFCLYVLFNHANSFNNYICASPSLWFVKGSFIPDNINNYSYVDSISILQGSLERRRKNKAMYIRNEKRVNELLQRGNNEFISITFDGKSHGEVIAHAIKFALQKTLEY